MRASPGRTGSGTKRGGPSGRPRRSCWPCAGKHKSGRTRNGNRWLRTALVEAAVAASRTKDSALAARYRRVMRHRGHHKAVVAVAHAMLRAIYHLLAEGTSYRELGADYYDHRHQQRVSRRAIQLLERLGYQVTRNAAA